MIASQAFEDGASIQGGCGAGAQVFRNRGAASDELRSPTFQLGLGMTTLRWKARPDITASAR